MSLLNKLALGLIWAYKNGVSPYLPNSCRYTPTCSQYARLAFLKYNFFKALLLSVWRILRCNPFVRGGYDPLK